jgi:hypothetical protein
MNEDSKQFLEALKDYNETHLSRNIWIPSLERAVKFSPMTAKHQKMIIQSSMDNPIFNVVFRQKTYEFIKELCQEPAIVDTLTVFDKDAILVQFRYHFVSKKYKDKRISELVGSFREMKSDFTPIENKEAGFKIQYKIPSVLDEKNIYKAYSKSGSYTVAPDTDDKIRDMVADLYFVELIKYIDKITIEKSGTTLNVSQQPLSHNMEIMEFLGKEVCVKIQNTIEEIIEKHDNIYKIDDDTRIEIGPNLLN